MDNHYSKSVSISKNEAYIPSSYRLYAIDIENSRGDVRDIKDLIVEFRLSESLHLPFIEAEFYVKDGANFFEEFGIKGNEKIRVRLSRTARDIKDQEVDIRFRLTQIPEYGRGNNGHEQAYVFTAISEHAYLSGFKTICRPIGGSISKEIKRLFVNDLLLDEDYFSIIGNPVTNFNGILNIGSPLFHANWLKNLLFDENQYPFFLYQSSYDSIVKLHSLYEMEQSDVYQEFYDKKFTQADTMSKEDYFERVSAILSVNSKLGISQSHIAKKGGYASEYRFIDFDNKKLIHQKKSIESGRTFDNDFRMEFIKNGSLKLLNENFVDREYRPLSANTYRSNGENYSTVNKQFEQDRSLVLSHYDNFVHDLRINGDSDMSPGRKIKLNFPKATDPQVYKQFTGKSPQDFIDESLSGEYIVFSVVHSFENGKYFNDIRVKKNE